MLINSWLNALRTNLKTTILGSSRRGRGKSRLDSIPEVQQLEDRALLATFSFDSAASELVYTSAPSEVDDLSVLGLGGSRFEVRSNDPANTFTLAGDAAGNPSFVLSSAIGVNDVLTVDSSLLANSLEILRFNLADEADYLMASDMTGLTGLTAFAVDAGPGNDLIDLTSLNLTPNGVLPLVQGGAGQDEIFGSTSGDVLEGGADIDEITAGAGDDIVGADQVPLLSINDVAVTEGDAGTVQADFTVTLSRSSNLPVTVDVTAVDRSATTANGDFNVAVGTLTFAPGETTKTFSVDVNGDEAPELDETFVVDLQNATNAGIEDARGVGTILNDDSPIISISDVTVAEGDNGTTTATFAVTLSQAGQTAVSVDFATADGTNNPATANNDYTPTNGTLNFAIGETRQTIDVTILSDTDVELDESFVVNLTNSVGAMLLDNQGLGIIANDDSPNASIDDVTVAEGNAAVFTVTLSQAPTQAVTIDYNTTSDSAESNADFRAAFGTVSFNAGETQKTITIDTIDDTLVEMDETFRVELLRATGANLVTATGIGTITDNDGPALFVTATPVTIAEDSGNTVMLTIRRNTGTNGAQTVNLDSSGAGELGAPATAIIADGAESVTIATTAVVDNAVADGNRTVTFTATATGFANGADDVVIVDDETPSLALAIAPRQVSEADGAAAAVGRVTRNSGTTGELVVMIAGSDATEATAQAMVTIPDGADFADFNIDAENDDLFDGDKVVTFTVTAAGHANAVNTLSVTDDEEATLTLVVVAASISENGGVTTATVTRNNGTVGDLDVALFSSDVSEVTVPQMVTIPDGVDSVDFQITAQDDQLADGNVEVTISGRANGFTSGRDALVVTDDEASGLSLDVETQIISEVLGVTVVTLSRNTGTTGDLEVVLNSAPKSAQHTGVVVIPTSVLIPDGQASVEFVAWTTGDVTSDTFIPAGPAGTAGFDITATAVGFENAETQIYVEDEDQANDAVGNFTSAQNQLNFTVTSEAQRSSGAVRLLEPIAGNTGAPPVAFSATARIRQAATFPDPFFVSINGIDEVQPVGLLNPPPATTIGPKTVAYDIASIADNAADGDQVVTVTIHDGDSAAAAPAFQYDVTIVDTDFLQLTINGDVVEGQTTTGTLKRLNGTVGDLDVFLLSSDYGEATVPARVTIPNGADEVNFNIVSVDDGLMDGAVNVNISARVDNTTQTSQTVEVADQGQLTNFAAVSRVINNVAQNSIIQFSVDTTAKTATRNGEWALPANTFQAGNITALSFDGSGLWVAGGDPDATVAEEDEFLQRFTFPTDGSNILVPDTTRINVDTALDTGQNIDADVLRIIGITAIGPRDVFALIQQPSNREVLMRLDVTQNTVTEADRIGDGANGDTTDAFMTGATTGSLAFLPASNELVAQLRGNATGTSGFGSRYQILSTDLNTVPAQNNGQDQQIATRYLDDVDGRLENVIATGIAGFGNQILIMNEQDRLFIFNREDAAKDVSSASVEIAGIGNLGGADLTGEIASGFATIAITPPAAGGKQVLANVVTATIDTVDSGDGDDLVFGSAGVDSLFGGAGNDRFVAGAGADNIDGGADDDTFFWSDGDGADNAVGGDGDDTFNFNVSTGLTADIAITFDGGTGNDAVVGTTGAGQNVAYLATDPGIQTPNTGQIIVTGANTLTLDFEGLTPITFMGAGGVLTIDASLLPAVSTLELMDDLLDTAGSGGNVVTGDAGFETTFFNGYEGVTIIGGPGTETIDLTSVDTVASGTGFSLGGIQLDGAADDDTINVADLGDSVTIFVRAVLGDTIVPAGGWAAGADTVTSDLLLGIPTRSFESFTQGGAELFVEGIVEFSVFDATALEASGTVDFDVVARHATNISISASVTFSTSALTATAGVDYTETSTPVLFLPIDADPFTGEAIMVVSVPVIDELIVESDETFLATLTLADVDGVIDPGFISTVDNPATGTIINDDTATITLVGPSATAEGSTPAGTTPFAFDVILSAPIQGGFTLPFTTNDGTATAVSADYIDNDGSLLFSGLAETQFITVLVNHDLMVEADETFDVTLGVLGGLDPGIDPLDVTFGSTMETGTIINDDTATITLVGPAATAEGSTPAGTTPFAFDVILSAPVQGGFTLPFTTNDGTATAISADYVDNDGSLLFGGLVETQFITVLVNHDLTVEADETFDVALGAVTGLGVGVDPLSFTVIGSPQIATILNDDATTLSISIPAITESNVDQPIDITVTSSAGFDGGFAIPFTFALGTAEATDVTFPAGTLTFSGLAGETSTLTVTVTGDQIVELDETFSLTIADFPGPVFPLATGDTATGTIVNDDLVITVELATDDATITALDSGNDEDNSAYTLREAILLSNAATGNQTINMIGLAGETIMLDGAELPTVIASVDLLGPAVSSPGQMLTISGDGRVNANNGRDILVPGSHGLLNIEAGDVGISNLHFTRGGADRGGAILVGDLSSSLVSIDNSIFSYNSAADSGGAIEADFGNSLIISDSSFLFNDAGSFGGAISVTDSASLDAENSTFYQNEALTGGAIRLDDDAVSRLNHVTLADNIAASSGAAISIGTLSGLTLENSIVAINNNVREVNLAAVGAPTDIDGPFTEVGVNLIGSDPLLSGLIDTSGPTPILVPSHLLTGNAYRSETRLSPAINAASGSSLTVDQRGLDDSGTSGGGIRNDIGAVEVTDQQSPPTTVTDVSIVDDVATVNFSFNPPANGSSSGATSSITVIVREYTLGADGDLIAVSSVPVATVVDSGGVDAANQKVDSASAGRRIISVPLVDSISSGGSASVSLSLGLGIYRVAVVGRNSDGIGSGGFTDIDGFFVDPSSQAAGSNAFEIVSSASVSTLPVSAPVLAETPTSAIAASILDVSLELQAAKDDFLNWAGQDEKWVVGKDGTWYAILPDGTLMQWDREGWLASKRAVIGPVVAQLSAAFYESTARLTSAVDAAPLTTDTAADLVLWLDQTIDFSTTDYSHFDGWALSDRTQFGDGEKWVRANTGQWYYLLPDGGMYRWERGDGLQGTLIADLPAIVYQEPQLLTNATAISLDYQYDLQLIDNKDYRNWGGEKERWLAGEIDGETNWFFVKPDGSLNLWSGGRDLETSTEVANIGRAYYSGNVQSANDGLADLHDLDALFTDWKSLFSL